MTRLRVLTVSISAYLAIAACTCLAQEGRLVASDSGFDPSNYEQRLADLEAEMQLLRSAQSQNRPYGCDNNCGRCCRCCPAPHWDVGAEATFLALSSTTNLGPAGSFFRSDKLLPSWRTWLGYTGSNGLGLRARYWDFDHIETNSINTFTYSLDTFVADLELTYSKVIGGDWDVLLSGGVRHVGFNEERTWITVTTWTVHSHLTGVVVGGEITRDLIGHLRGYGVARAAVVFGGLRGDLPAGFIVLSDNRPVFMWEAQLGLEYRRDTRIGEVSLRLGVEAQVWNDVTFIRSSSSGVDAESIGFVGIVTGLTLRR